MVRKLISKNFLKESLKDVKYDSKAFRRLSIELADSMLSAVKEFGYQRYKFIIKVLFIQKTGQAINVSTPPIPACGLEPWGCPLWWLGSLSASSHTARRGPVGPGVTRSPRPVSVLSL